MTAAEDKPVGYELTEAGWRAVREVWTADRAADGLGQPRRRLAAARRGELEGVKFGREWLFARADVEAWVSAWGRLDPGPLLDAIASRGGPSACGVRPRAAEAKALERAWRSGEVTVSMADHLAIRLLGLTLRDLWGSADDEWC